METRLSSTFQTTNITNLTKVIQQNSYRVLQVTSKWKTLKQPVYFLKAVEFWHIFDIHVDITLAIFGKPFKNMKNCFLGGSFLKWENCRHLEFLTNQIFGQRFIIFKKWGVGINYCWNYGLSKLLLHFIEYLLDQLNNKHTKTAVNSAIQYFDGCSQNKCLLKVWSFLIHAQQNVKFRRN